MPAIAKSHSSADVISFDVRRLQIAESEDTLMPSSCVSLRSETTLSSGSLENSGPRLGLLFDVFLVLLARLDCSGIFLDRLIYHSMITDIDRKSIQDFSPFNFYRSNHKLLHILAKRYPDNFEENEATFRKALQESNQKHIVRLIFDTRQKAKGVNAGNENLESPDYLTDNEIKSIESHDNDICSLITCTSQFIESLLKWRCIGNRHQSRLLSLPAGMFRCQFLIDVIKRGSRETFNGFLEALKEDKQFGVVNYIQDLATLHVIISFGSTYTENFIRTRKNTIISRLTLDYHSPCQLIKPPPNFTNSEGLISCVCQNILFVIAAESMWKFIPIENKWTECASLPNKRYFACMEGIENFIYVLGGSVKRRSKTLGLLYFPMTACLLKYSIEKDTWLILENLIHNVEKAASVSFKNYIYLFDGYDKKEAKHKFIEIFDTDTNENRTVSAPWLPDYGQIKAVLYKNFAILVGMEDVLVYDLLNEELISKIPCSCGRRNFGLTLCRDFVYLVGGSKVGLKMNQCSKRVKRLSLPLLLNEQDRQKVSWENHMNLSEYSQEQFCSRTTLIVPMP